MMMQHEDVEFRTIDGLLLRGRVYPANERGPGIILSPGVSRASATARIRELR